MLRRETSIGKTRIFGGDRCAFIGLKSEWCRIRGANGAKEGLRTVISEMRRVQTHAIARIRLTIDLRTPFFLSPDSVVEIDVFRERSGSGRNEPVGYFDKDIPQRRTRKYSAAVLSVALIVALDGEETKFACAWDALDLSPSFGIAQSIGSEFWLAQADRAARTISFRETQHHALACTSCFTSRGSEYVSRTQILSLNVPRPLRC